MRKKKFIAHFIILTLFIFGLGYFSSNMLEKESNKQYYQSLLNKAKKASAETIRIINNRHIDNKNAGIHFVYEGLLNTEPSFAFYQICKIKKNGFQPIISAKRHGAESIRINHNDVYDEQNEIKNNFITKYDYNIYHQDLAMENLPYGRLFIGFYKKSAIESNYEIYKHIFAFILGIIIVGILIFSWYYRKVDKIKPVLLLQAQQRSKANEKVHSVDKINLDELFDPKKESPFPEKDKQLKDNPTNTQRNKYG